MVFGGRGRRGAWPDIFNTFRAYVTSLQQATNLSKQTNPTEDESAGSAAVTSTGGVFFSLSFLSFFFLITR